MTDRLTSDDPQLVASVKLGEGLRLRAYPDPLTGAAPWTCGVGHTGPEVGPTTTCTAAQAESWLQSDLADAIWALDDRLAWWRGLPLDAQRVLAEMAFNLGIGGLCGFHRFLVELEAGRFENAANAMMHSLWASQVGARAARLSERIKACAAAEFGASLTAKALEA